MLNILKIVRKLSLGANCKQKASNASLNKFYKTARVGFQKMWVFHKGEQGDAGHKVMPDTHLYVQHTLPLNNYITLFISGYESKEQCANGFAEETSLYFFLWTSIYFPSSGINIWHLFASSIMQQQALKTAILRRPSV